MARFSVFWQTAAVGIGAMLFCALAGCGGASGVVQGGSGPVRGVPDASGMPDPLSSVGSLGTTGSLGSAVAPAWVLTAPSSVFGFSRIQPSSANLQKITDSLAKGAAPLGVSGTPVIAVYDDPQHDVYLILAGYNGQGFDPAKLPPLFNVQPVYTNDGAGDRVTLNSQTIDAGDHGGTAGCSSQVLQMGGLATEGTVCTWLTGTTMGSVSYYPKPDEKQMVFGAGPDLLGKVMRDMRDLAERRQ